MRTRHDQDPRFRHDHQGSVARHRYMVTISRTELTTYEVWAHSESEAAEKVNRDDDDVVQKNIDYDGWEVEEIEDYGPKEWGRK